MLQTTFSLLLMNNSTLMILFLYLKTQLSMAALYNLTDQLSSSTVKVNSGRISCCSRIFSCLSIWEDLEMQTLTSFRTGFRLQLTRQRTNQILQLTGMITLAVAVFLQATSCKYSTQRSTRNRIPSIR